MRDKLRIESPLFINAETEFNYNTIGTSIIDNVQTLYGELHIVGFDDTLRFSCTENNTFLSPINSQSKKPSSYSYELIETISKIMGEPDISVYYSLFKKPAQATTVINAKKTLVYIPGGPWLPFSTHHFLKSYQPFINEGYTIIIPHEPMRGGFGYNYLCSEKQFGRNNLHHIMAILDDACNKGANPHMVLMGESYGGWVASALAATWKDFKTPESLVELHGCIAQAATLDLNYCRDWHVENGEPCFAQTFADNPVDVANITTLQSSLLIFHGLGDVRCTIDSMRDWTKNLIMKDQRFTFITAPEEHVDTLISPKLNAEEYELRFNMVLRFIEGDIIPAASVEKLSEFNLSVVHDSAGLFEQSNNNSTANS